MKISVGAAISAAAVTAAVTVTLTYTYAMNRFNAKVADVNERQAMYEKLAEIDDKTRQDYVGTIDEQSVTDGMCAGYLAGLGDSHTKYLTAKEYKVYRDSAEALSTGVGISTVRDSDGNMEVVEVVPDSPAEKAGIKKGDTIIQADGKDVVRITYASAIQLLDGTAGTTVTFRLLRVVQAAPAASVDTSSDTDSAAGAAETQTIDVTVTRGEYSKTTVTSSMINGNVASLRISPFADGTACKSGRLRRCGRSARERGRTHAGCGLSLGYAAPCRHHSEKPRQRPARHNGIHLRRERGQPSGERACE